jgi:hypothetical protein
MNNATGSEKPLPSPPKKGKENDWSDENICPSDNGTKRNLLTSSLLLKSLLFIYLIG